MKRTNAPSEREVKKLFALSGNQCAFPDCLTAIVQPSGTVTGKICHIRARSPEGPRYDPAQTDKERHDFANLILLCSVHHDIVDNEPKRFTVEVLQEMKEVHERNKNTGVSHNDVRLARRLMESYLHIAASGYAQVMVDSPGAIQTRSVTIKTTSKKATVPLPPDAIGSCIEMRSYVEYLIRRYINWRMRGTKSGIDKRPFQPSMIHNLIQRNFGSRANLVPQNRFEELVEFMQKAIDGTIIGRSNCSNHVHNYHSFEEHLEQVRGNKRTPEEGISSRVS